MSNSELESEASNTGFEEVTESEWMKLSPIAVLYFASSTIKHTLGNIIYVAPGFIAGFSTFKQYPILSIFGLLALISLPLGYGALSFFFYRFRLNEKSVEIRSGVFSKKHLNLPFERIQNVKFEQPFYYRPFDYCCVELDTAGSSGKEAKIVSMHIAAANNLKEHILNYAEQAHGQESTIDQVVGTNPKDQSSTQETVLNRRSISDLVIHGITSNRVWILIAGLAPFYDNISNTIVSWMSSLGIDIDSLIDQTSTPIWQIIIFFLIATFIIILTITLLSILGAIIMFYGFTLSKTKERYIQRSGLITKREVSMKVSRIQVAIRKQDWLDSLLGRMNLIFEQKSQSVQNGNVAANMQQKLTIPSIKLHECYEIIDDALPDNRMANVNYQPIHKRFISHNIILRLVPIFGPALAILIYSQQYENAAFTCLGLLLATSLIILRWKRWGYDIDGQFLYVRKGLIGVSYYCVPIFKVQQTRIKQSLFMRRSKLAHAEFVLASGLIKVPFVKHPKALNLIDTTLYQVESTQRSWM